MKQLLCYDSFIGHAAKVKENKQDTTNKEQRGGKHFILKKFFMSQELQDRFQNYASRVRDFCRKLKWNIINTEYIRQLIRASASVGANYIEAGDDIGKADEKMKIKIARREAKESVFWLTLVLTYDDAGLEKERKELIDEGSQIRKILSAILKKME